ncbi:MAG: IS630 family transposase [Rhodovulum sp.]|nr:IS630 family transposase [Rhodovulum sp.]
MAARAGKDVRRGRGADELRAALGGAAARALQRLRPGKPRRPAARERRGADGADAGAAGSGAGAGAAAPRRRWGLDGEKGGDVHGGRTRAPCRRAARLGSAARDRLDDPAPAAAPRGSRVPRGAGGVQKKLADVVAEEAARHPGATVETFATDEHRIGLKPILRRVWAPRGERPIARGHHRFEWFYVTAFVSPATGESFWYLGTGVSKELFEGTLALFAREAGAGRDRIIVLVLDGAGYHTLPLAVPEGIRLVFLPAYTPELQPAETLWVHVDEPIVNRHFQTLDDLDAVVADRCVALANDRDLIRGQAGFHWWPKRTNPI